MSSKPEPSKAMKLVSQLLLEDADLRDIVEEFVAGLTVRMDELRAAHQRMDWDELAMLAHRLKGAAGSYGYPDISQLCAEMELAFRAHQADSFATWLTELDDLLRAAREGLDEVG
jgi:HPt (histidine-containing phosphotransfer) domain-containing protein